MPMPRVPTHQQVRLHPHDVILYLRDAYSMHRRPPAQKLPILEKVYRISIYLEKKRFACVA